MKILVSKHEKEGKIMKKNFILSITSISTLLATTSFAVISCGNNVVNSDETTDPSNPSNPGDGSQNPGGSNKPGNPDGTNPGNPGESTGPSNPGDGSTNPDKPSNPGDGSTNPGNPDKPTNPPINDADQVQIQVDSVKLVSNQDVFTLDVTGSNLDYLYQSNYINFYDLNGTRIDNPNITLLSKLDGTKFTFAVSNFDFQGKKLKVKIGDQSSPKFETTIDFGYLDIVNRVNEYANYLYDSLRNYSNQVQSSITNFDDYKLAYENFRKMSTIILKNTGWSITSVLEVKYGNNSNSFEYSLYFDYRFTVRKNNEALKSSNAIFNNPSPKQNAIEGTEYITTDGFHIVGSAITGYTGTSKDIVIKSKYTCQDPNVILPTITSIAPRAFYGIGIRSVTFAEDSVITKIGDYAFNINDITTLTLPKSVTEIGEAAFGINRITTVDLSKTSITKIGNNAFRANRITSLTLPNTIQEIGNYAFKDSKITKLELANSAITKIGLEAFIGNAITTLTLPNSIQEIGESAFANNLINSTINLSKTKLTSIQNNTFANNKITIVNLDNSMITSVGESAFRNNLISSLTLTSSINNIGVGAFADNQIGSTLDLAKTKITSINNEAFKNNKIEAINWDTKIRFIGVSSFEGNMIKNVDFTKTNITTVQNNTFKSNKISSIKWDSRIDWLGVESFANNSLVNLDFTGTNLTRINDSAFKDNQISNLKLTSKIITLGNSCLENNKLTSFDFKTNGNIDVMGTAALKNNLITNIIWNDKITRVSKEAFANNKLTNKGLNLQTSKIVHIEPYAFAYNELKFNVQGRNPETIIDLPSTMKVIEKGAFNSKEILLHSWDSETILGFDMFSINGNKDQFWAQISTINVISLVPEFITQPTADWYRDHWQKWSFNWYLIDTNGTGRLL